MSKIIRPVSKCGQCKMQKNGNNRENNCQTIYMNIIWINWCPRTCFEPNNSSKRSECSNFHCNATKFLYFQWKKIQKNVQKKKKKLKIVFSYIADVHKMTHIATLTPKSRPIIVSITAALEVFHSSKMFTTPVM